MSGRIGKAFRDVLIILAITLGIMAAIEVGFRLYARPVAFRSDDEVIATLKPSFEKVFLRAVDGAPSTSTGEPTPMVSVARSFSVQRNRTNPCASTPQRTNR